MFEPLVTSSPPLLYGGRAGESRCVFPDWRATRTRISSGLATRACQRRNSIPLIGSHPPSESLIEPWRYIFLLYGAMARLECGALSLSEIGADGDLQR
jgi:hypothetical protein